jgi:hypothetical protein
MYYGEEKIKEMSRSVLPSKGRVKARKDKRNLNKKVRKYIRMNLHYINNEDSYLDSNIDIGHDGREDRVEIISNRRDADKLGPFLSWAKNKAKHVPSGEKMNYISGMMNRGNVITDHALSHLRWQHGFYDNLIIYEPRRTFNRADLADALKKICGIRKYHYALNDAIRENHLRTKWQRLIYRREVKVPVNNNVQSAIEKKFIISTEEKFIDYDKTISYRLLMGSHDIDNFINDVLSAFNCNKMIKKIGYEHHVIMNYISYRPIDIKIHKDFAANPNYHPEWLNVVKLFVEDFILSNIVTNKFSIYSSTAADSYKAPYGYMKAHPKRYCKFNWTISSNA